MGDSKDARKGWKREYLMLNAGAHRKPPARIGVPSICRHRAFWMPSDSFGLNNELQFSENKAYEIRRETWILGIESFLAAYCSILIKDPASNIANYAGATFDDRSRKYKIKLLRRVAVFDEHGELERLDRIENSYQSRYELFAIKGLFKGIRIQSRAELHGEYFTFTTIAEFDRESGKETADRKKSLEKKFKAIAACASRRLDELQDDSISDVDHANNIKNHRIEMQKISTYFFDGFWEKYEKKVVEPALKATLHPIAINKLENMARNNKQPVSSIKVEIGGMIADFRAVIFQTEIFKSGKRYKKLELHPPFKASGRIPLHKLTEDAFRKGAKGEADAIMEVDAFLPFFEGAEKLTKNASAFSQGKIKGGNPEYVASLLLNKRAIYLSSLGAMRSLSGGRSSDEKNPPPVRYLILSKTPHRWLMGRLVERINYLGTLRLASLKDLDHLERANEVLRDVELDLNAMNANPDLIKDRQKTFDEAEPGEKENKNGAEGEEKKAGLAEEKRGGKLDSAHRNYKQEIEYLRECVKLADVYPDPKTGRTLRCDVGLNYRIERSRYYAKAFEDTLKGLRVDRIPGFQQYDEFVSRRIGSTWDFIDRLGVRIDRINRKFDSTILASQFRSTVNLLKIAEVAALAAATYYFHAMLKEVLLLFHCDKRIAIPTSILLGAMCYVFLIHLAHFNVHKRANERYKTFLGRKPDLPYPGKGKYLLLLFMLFWEPLRGLFNRKTDKQGRKR